MIRLVISLVAVLSLTACLRPRDNPFDPRVSNFRGETENHAPVISSFTCDPTVTDPGDTTTLTVTASDPDGDELSYAYTFTEGDGSIAGSGREVTATVNQLGTNVVQVTVSDGNGGEAERLLDLSVNGVPWYDSAWSYRREVTVSDAAAAYQTKVTVSLSADAADDVDCGGHCNDDFSDLRFVTQDGTALPYWIEEHTAGDDCTVWVKNTPGDATLFLYYGNAGAGDIGDPESTFIYYTDFSSDPGIVRPGGDGGAFYFGNFSHTGGFYLQADMELYWVSAGEFSVDTHYQLSGDSRSYALRWMEITALTGEYSDLPAAQVDTFFQISANTRYKVQTKYIPGVSHEMYFDGVIKDTASSPDNYSDFDEFRLGIPDWISVEPDVSWDSVNNRIDIQEVRTDTGKGMRLYIREIFLGKYSSPEPSFAFGAEEME